MEKSWHPYADEYPMMEGKPWVSFKRCCKEAAHKEPILYRLVAGEKQYLDGRNRAKAADELGITWPEHEVKVADGEVRKFIDLKNLHRRQLTKKQRDKLVHRMLSQGYTQKEAASKTGQSQQNVSRVSTGKKRKSYSHEYESGGNTGETPRIGPLADCKWPLSPKMAEEAKAWPKGKQLDFLAAMDKVGGDVRKAMHMLANQREAGDEAGAARFAPDAAGIRLLKKKDADKCIRAVEALPYVVANDLVPREKQSEEFVKCNSLIGQFRFVWERWLKRMESEHKGAD